MKALGKNRVRMAGAILLLLLTCHFASGAMILLAWEPPTNNIDGTPITDLAGYRIYYGSHSGGYSNSVDVGNTLSAGVGGLTAGEEYYFAITAYNRLGEESGFSEELTWNSDSDGDGMPDAWEIGMFGAAIGTDAEPQDDADGDGQSNLQEYYAGSHPTNAASCGQLKVRHLNGALRLEYECPAASGAAYDGRQRFSTLEKSPSLSTPSWTAVPGHSHLLGANQTDSYDERGGSAFFRVITTLE